MIARRGIDFPDSTMVSLEGRDQELTKTIEAKPLEEKKWISGNSCGVKCMPHALLIAHLQRKVIAAKSQPKFEQKAACFRLRQMWKCSGNVGSAAFSTRRKNLTPS